MAKYLLSTIILIALLPLLSCHQQAKQQGKGTKSMFNLQQFMQQEWQRESKSLNGFVRISGEEKYTDTTALSSQAARQYFDELGAAYPGKDKVSDYRSETVEDNVTGNLTLIYTALNKQASPYQIELNLDRDNNVKSVYVTYYEKNFLWQSSKKIFYSVGNFLQLISSKKILFFPKSIKREKILLRLPS